MNNIINHVLGTKSYTLTSGFRPANRPDHNGLDFVDAKRQEATERGVDILAIADGEVVEYTNGSLVGVTIAILHEGKILSRYQHMRLGSVLVKKGDKVKKGQVIGVMGNTGSCISSNTSIPAEYRGTHLHIGIKENSTSYNTGSWVNPIPYLTGQKTIKSSSVPATVSPDPVPQPAQTPDFKTGDTVQVKQTAQRYATGQYIPAWVKNNKYKIIQVGREKVLLGTINSWVYEADINKV